MRKAPCISAGQSKMQGTRTQPNHGGLVLIVYHGPLQKARRIYAKHFYRRYHRCQIDR